MDFLTELSDVYSEDADLALLVTAVELLKSVNPQKVVELFGIGVAEYREVIARRDAEYFRSFHPNAAILGAAQAGGGDPNRLLQVVGKIQSHWKDMSPSNRTKVFDYLNNLVTLHDMYYRSKPRKS